MRTRTISEIMDQANRCETPEAAARVLGENYTPQLVYILQGVYDPAIRWLLPAGTPPYTADDSPPGLSETTIYNQVNMFRYLVEVNKRVIEPSVKQPKREEIFIRMLEVLPADDAKLVIAMKDKDISELYPNITRRVVELAFPGAIKDGFSLDAPQPEPTVVTEPPAKKKSTTNRSKKTTKKETTEE